MHQAVAYIIESAVIFAVLVSFYKYACYRLSYYKWDRFFLISCIVICYALPFCKISNNAETVKPNTENISIKSITLGTNAHTITLSREITMASRIKRAINSPAFYTLLLVLIIIYIAGAAIKAVSVTRALLKITRLKRGTPETTPDGIKIYTADSRTPAFSFFDNIFVNKAFHTLDTHSQEIILHHERQHISGHHSVDVIIFSLLSILQWFNPAVKKAAALSRQICENIADSHVSKDAKAEYTMLLLKLGQQKSAPTIANESGNLKDRVLNIFSYDRVYNRKLRFACALPILLLLLGAYIIIGGKLNTKTKSNCTFPITGGYKVVAEYFDSQLCTGTNRKSYQISHHEVMFCTPLNAKIIAPIKGNVTSASSSEISITSGDTTITIKNISPYKIGANVDQGQTIAFTSAATTAIKVEINNLPINPSILFNY
ncbi:MAG: hypothetical protein J6Y24_06035 [Bacteroidales bacterium]|nr:hypothetical protein [Bacteroidales bacterium]